MHSEVYLEIERASPRKVTILNSVNKYEYPNLILALYLICKFYKVNLLRDHFAQKYWS